MSDQPSEEALQKWHRYFAVECNNRAWQLAEIPTRTADEETEMLHSAHAAALHWAVMGAALNNARAEMLLAHAYALLGEAGPAMRYARTSFDFFEAHHSPDWEMAFAHAILAHAACVSNASVLHGTHYARAKEIGATLDEENRTIFNATFTQIPAPQG